MSFVITKGDVMQNFIKQTGAVLCQAQFKLGLVKASSANQQDAS